MFVYYNLFKIVLFVLIGIAAYVISGISLYNIGNRCGVRNSWLAFIPFLQFYVIGSICEEYIFCGYRIKNLSWIMCALMFLSEIKGGLILGIVSLVATMLSLLVLHKFFYLFNPQRAMIYTAVCIFGNLPLAVILFLLKDTPMQMSAGAYPYPFANRP